LANLKHTLTFFNESASVGQNKAQINIDSRTVFISVKIEKRRTNNESMKKGIFLQLGNVSLRSSMTGSVSAGIFKRSLLYTKP
jgi:hypothetical protein